MYLGKNILVVIPARGGSKGIPGKNVRFLNNKPLLQYSIETANKSSYVDTVVVTSEDERILELATLNKVDVVKRPSELSSDEIPLDPVIYHALRKVEEREEKTYDVIITLQPTSPLLSSQTLDTAIRSFFSKSVETMISALGATHLYWHRNGDHSYTPMYQKRCNRQYLDPIYKEAGAFLISKRTCVTEHSRIGSTIDLFILSEREGLDIDDYSDLWTAINYLKQPKVGFRVDGDLEIGLGHVYRTITLAGRIFNPDIYFFLPKGKELAIKKIKEHNYKIVEFGVETDLIEKIKELRVDIVINDMLDTTAEYVATLKKTGVYVVNFEDLGEGAELAHLVVNALYENSHHSAKYCYGYKYLCLRDDFYQYPFTEVRREIKNVVLMFGGVDKSNLTMRSLNALEQIGNKLFNIRVILGLGYSQKDTLFLYIHELIDKGFNISLQQNINSVARVIAESDLVLTSNGRTIYEVAAMGVPCISISQNERESRHLFAHYSRGIKNLGRAAEVSEDDITKAIREITDNFDLRKKMSKRLQKYDLRSGTDRVISKIFGGYEKWESTK